MSTPTKDELAGMTVNERLFATGALQSFQAAARKRDRDEMVRLLATVDVSSWTADTIIADPQKYGF